MSCIHGDSIRPIAKLIPCTYNYMVKTDFSTVHYYNGNSSRLSPIQLEWGPIAASFCRMTASLGGLSQRICTERLKLHCHRRNSPSWESVFMGTPRTSIETGAIEGYGMRGVLRSVLQVDKSLVC